MCDVIFKKIIYSKECKKLNTLTLHYFVINQFCRHLHKKQVSPERKDSFVPFVGLVPCVSYVRVHSSAQYSQNE